MLMLEKVFGQGLVFNLALCPKCMDRLLSCPSFFEKIAACHRMKRPPWTAGLENLYGNEEKLHFNLLAYLVVCR